MSIFDLQVRGLDFSWVSRLGWYQGWTGKLFLGVDFCLLIIWFKFRFYSLILVVGFFIVIFIIFTDIIQIFLQGSDVVVFSFISIFIVVCFQGSNLILLVIGLAWEISQQLVRWVLGWARLRFIYVGFGFGQRSCFFFIFYDGGDVEVGQVRVFCKKRGQRDCFIDQRRVLQSGYMVYGFGFIRFYLFCLFSRMLLGLTFLQEEQIVGR